jgi:cytochrome c-type biogenesis protein CcmE
VAARRAHGVIEAMNARKRRRLMFAGAVVLAGAGGAALVVNALKDNVLYFYSPSDLQTKHVPPGVAFRIGGLVERGSVKHGPGSAVHFLVTDGRVAVPVEYTGILPDLFREGQGVVAMGAMTPDGAFEATEVLAKHSASYMPPEVEAALKKAGMWNPATGQPPPAAAFDGSLGKGGTKLAGG